MSELSNETTKASAAYADYAAMGVSRSLAKLVEKYNKNTSYIRQLAKWSVDFDWQTRVKTYDAEKLAEEETRRKAVLDTMNARQVEQAQEMQDVAIRQIKVLMIAQAFGSLASVQLLKNSVEAERKALHADDDTKKVQITGKNDGPVLISTTWGGGSLEDE